MKRNSHQTGSHQLALRTTTALCLMGSGTVAVAQPAVEAPPASALAAVDVAAQVVRLNPTGRDITLTAPLRDGPFILGELDFVLGADDSVRVNARRLLEVLGPILDPARFAELEAALTGVAFAPAAQITALGYGLSYDPETIGLIIEIPPSARTTRQVRLARFDDVQLGELDEPAGFSGYVNFRTFTDYTWSGPDQGLRAPTALIDSAIRFRGIVLENEATLRLEGGNTQTFVREGTRFVYDDRRRLARWTLGDLRPISRGFAGAPQLAGISLVRLYSVLEPQRNVQPRGDRTFTLTRSSTVEAFINGQPVRRIRLDPGTYNVRDFPFVQGSNDVRLVIEDDAGGREEIGFSFFFDRTLLAPGLTEFGLFAGVLAPFSGGSRDYRFDEPAASGFFRRGFSQAFTGGVNFNVNRRGAVVGGEAVFATPFGTLGGDLALSQVDNIGTGYAFNVSLLRTFGGQASRGRSVALSAEHRSRNFANPTELFADNRFSWDFAATYAQAIGELQFISVTGQYSIGRGPVLDEKSVRVTYGLRITPRINLTADAIYEDRALFGEDYGVRVGVTFRFGRRSSVSAEYDSRVQRGRIGYQTSRGDGVGSWSASADLDVGEDDVGFDGGVNYTANRAEIGLNHSTIFDITGSQVDSQRTSLRFGTAIAFADGSLALSRPIFDSFAMVRPHRTLQGATVYVDPREGTYTARSDFFGPAVEPDLSAYTERVITFDVPNAPIGYDLGQGNVRVSPPYRSGYLVIAGSDYSVTAVGTFLDRNGAPVSLLAGSATELSAPDRPPITVFTNRSGRFGISGLRPGRWRIDMPTEPPSSVVIDVPAAERGVLRLGQVQLGDPQ